MDVDPRDVNESGKGRPNPGDPGPPAPDPEETKRVDPREDPRIPEAERETVTTPGRQGSSP
jgi:hypothetical protein